MELYQRIAAGDEEPAELLEELTDRFGRPPNAVDGLLRAAQLKRRAEALGVQSIRHSGTSLKVRLRRDNEIDLDTLVRWIGERPEAQFSPAGVLTVEAVPAPSAVDAALQILGELAA
jgi:transcription-repair coupling factor (superfamily II helicase)